jgi:adenylate cyclase
MAKEIERKWLVKNFPDEKPFKESKNLFQGYLKTGIDYEVRISNRCHLTAKSGSGLVREENIFDISPEIYNALLPLTVGKQVHKSRLYFKIHDDLVAEVDVYEGPNEGIKTVEVEFPDEESAKSFQPPEWFGEEVSDNIKYKNSLLAC